MEISNDTVHKKISEQHIWQKSFKFNSFAVLNDLLSGNSESSHYSVSYGDTALKLFHDTEH